MLALQVLFIKLLSPFSCQVSPFLSIIASHGKHLLSLSFLIANADVVVTGDNTWIKDRSIFYMVDASK